MKSTPSLRVNQSESYLSLSDKCAPLKFLLTHATSSTCTIIISHTFNENRLSHGAMVPTLTNNRVSQSCPLPDCALVYCVTRCPIAEVITLCGRSLLSLTSLVSLQYHQLGNLLCVLVPNVSSCVRTCVTLYGLVPEYGNVTLYRNLLSYLS